MPTNSLRRELLQVARHGEQHGGRDLEQRARQVFDVLAEVRHQLRQQRQRHRDVAPEDVAQREVGDRPVRALGQRRVVLDQVERRGQMLAVRDAARPFGCPDVPEV